MAIIETKTYECDCCGRQSNKSDFNTGSVCGVGNLTLSGHNGGAAYNGDWGGSSYNIKKLLCFSCAEKVTEFLRELIKQSKDSEPQALRLALEELDMNEELEVKNEAGAKCGKSDKSALLAEHFRLQSSFNTQEFIETLVKDGMDNSTIIGFVKQQEALSRNLYEFMHEAVKHCWMGKSWTPQQIREKGVELGLMIKKEEYVYSYSDELKKYFG